LKIGVELSDISQWHFKIDLSQSTPNIDFDLYAKCYALSFYNFRKKMYHFSIPHMGGLQEKQLDLSLALV
jgi:hypothetical protein